MSLVRASIFILLSALAVLLLPPSGKQGIPRQIHLSWEDPSTRTITVMWATKTSGGGAEASFGTSPALELGSRPALSFRLPRAPWTLFHSARLGPLEAGRDYYYRVGKRGDGWSSIYRFATAHPSSPFTFVAAADMGINAGAAANTLQMAAANPAFALLAGDLAYAHGDQARWDAWLEQMEPLAARAPLMATLGNHEHKGGWELATYLGRLELPGDERNYSFDCGNLHVVALDSGSTYDSPAEELTEWLVRDLQEAVETKNPEWIVVFFHFPPFSSGPHGSWMEGRNAWSPIFDRYRVDLVLNGHEHSYERSWPVRADGTSPGESYRDPQAPVYVVTGGSGGYSLSRYRADPPLWSAFRASENETLRVKVDRLHLEVEAIRPDGTRLDAFTIEKTRRR